jgi:hypothetical protein
MPGLTGVPMSVPRRGVGGGGRVPPIDGRFDVTRDLADALGTISRAAWPKQAEVGRHHLAAFECEMSVKTRLGAYGLGRTSVHQPANTQQSLIKIWLPEQDSNLRPFD